CKLNAAPGVNVYVRAATIALEPDDKRFTTDADVALIPGAWADCDDAEAAARALSCPIPGVRVCTGQVPNLRMHLWVKLNEPMAHAPWGRELNQRLHKLTQGDSRVVNPSRMMRLPGMLAWPRKPGRVLEIVSIDPASKWDAVTRDWLGSKLPELAPTSAGVNGASGAPNGSSAAAGALNQYTALIEEIRANAHQSPRGQWHNLVLVLVGKLVERGVPAPVIMAMAEHLTWPDFTVEDTAKEMARMITGAYRKGFGEAKDGEEQADPKGPDVAAEFPPPPSLQLLTEEETCRPVLVPWLVEDTIPAGGLVVVYGAPGSFKSFAMLDLACRLARGWIWLGKRTVQTGVVYLVGEGSGGFGKRLRAWRQYHGVTEFVPEFRSLPRAVNLLDPAEVTVFIAAAKTALAEAGIPIGAVFADTWSRSLTGGDEDKARDSGIATHNALRIQTELGCTFIAIHHPGKDEGRGARGSSALPGNADTIIHAERQGDAITLTMEKQKDGEDGQAYRLRAETVEMLVPGQLAPESSLVVIEVAGDGSADPGAPLPGDKQTRLNKREQTARR
ncbi:MAG TPA: AAA family ATPase, partial [Gaiellales bacterium]|nr:AAA family ATPase [Gaiellales bacterium]